MFLDSLNITQFRNLGSVSVHFSQGKNLLFGQNGSGKSNLLEAIYYLCTSKSFRGVSDDSIVQNETDLFRLEGEFSGESDTLLVELTFQKHGRKRLRIDSIVQPKLQVLYEHLKVVFFGPDDVDLIYGPPSIRRRFLDISIAQLQPGYIQLLWEYKKVVAQRNALLREMSEAYNSLGAVADDQLLQVWDEKLVETGLGINRARASFLQSISQQAKSLHRKLTNTGETIEIDYRPSPSLDEYSADAYTNKLRARRTRELAMGQSMYGPHRDDISFMLSGHDCRNFASRGQIKSAVLATKLGVLEVMTTLFEEPPILLLDEIFSDLDRQRLDLLLSLLDHLGQVIMTTSKLQDVKELDNFQNLLKIQAGSVSRYTV